DSLMLTQIALQLQKTFGVKVTFRQLMSDCASPERLVAILDATLPADLPVAPAAADAVMPATAAQAATAPPPPPAALPAGAATLPPLAAEGGDFARQLIAQQMQLMGQQLALLAGQGSGVMPAAAAACPSVSAAPPPAISPPPVTSENDLRMADDALAHTTYDV